MKLEKVILQNSIGGSDVLFSYQIRLKILKIKQLQKSIKEAVILIDIHNAFEKSLEKI